MADNVGELYMKAKEAYDAIPKDFFKREHIGDVVRFSCPKCGVIFAEIPADATFQFHQPMFCCGKLLT